MLPDQINARVRLLEQFLATLRDYWDAGAKAHVAERTYDDEALPDLRRRVELTKSAVNRQLAAASAAAEQAGVGTTITVAPPPAVGGLVARLDVFENVFGDMYLEPVLPHTIQCVERAIGAYVAMQLDPTLGPTTTSGSLDLVNGVRRALRPSFRDGPPKNEREVQGAVEVILRALGVDYARDKEVAPVGSTSFKPDFTVAVDDLAIEVKLANEKHDAAAIQHELAEDVAGYKTKWKRLIAIVYDCGVIHDPEQMREANERHFGVTVLIVKH